jgi:phage protein D/phage baseplate assembly protein gpV
MAGIDAKPTFTNVAKVLIGGKDVSRDKTLGPLLGSLWFECAMNLPSAFHIQFNDNYQQMMKDPAAAGLLSLGKKVELFIAADGTGDGVPLLTGEITGIETDTDGLGPATTVVRGMDHAFKMMQHRRTKIYTDMTATAILIKLAGQDGVEWGPDFEMSPIHYKTISQPNISDWEFATQLAARNGMYVGFDGSGLLQFQKIPLATVPGDLKLPEFPLVLEVGGNARRCRIGLSASDQVALTAVRGWDVEKNIKLEFETPTVPYRGRTIPAQSSSALNGKALTYLDTSTPYGSLDEVTTTARALSEDISSVFAELEIFADGNPGLQPGETVLLKAAGEKYDGTYTITSARHEFTRAGRYETLVTVSGHQVRNVYGLASGASGPRNRIHGVVNAIVTHIDDPLQQGRVRVKFPWLDDDYTTRWARTLQFGGQGGGGVISPAVDDEVLVAFDRGDIDYPYVLGGLYGHDVNKPSVHDTPLTTEPGHLNRQSLVSRAGHRLELLNADGGALKHGVRLQTGNKMLTIFMDESKTEISIDSTGRISISGKEKVSVTSTGEVSVNAPSVSIEATKISITGAVSIVGNLSITGATEATGDVSVIGGLNQLGDAVFTGDVDVIGILKEDGVPVV